jgi:hypothetical protein
MLKTKGRSKGELTAFAPFDRLRANGEGGPVSWQRLPAIFPYFLAGSAAAAAGLFFSKLKT